MPHFTQLKRAQLIFEYFFFKLKNPSIFNFNICIRIKGYFFYLGYVIEDSINKNHTFYSDTRKVAACDSSLWIILNLLLQFCKKKLHFLHQWQRIVMWFYTFNSDLERQKYAFQMTQLFLLEGKFKYPLGQLLYTVKIHFDWNIRFIRKYMLSITLL